MIDKKKATALFLEKLEVWEKSQQGQTSAYAYEKSYEEFINLLSKELLQESIGNLLLYPTKNGCLKREKETRVL